jgi:phosphatidylserine/phosphatidylglycerophosphate/cardiolipin synthase-like enzyme
VEVYFAPDGGFAPVNQNRSIETSSGKQMAPTLNNAVKALIDDTKDGGQIKIAMYAFSEKGMQNDLIDAAFKRNIKVKLLLDGVADWTEEIRADIIKSVKTASRGIKRELTNNFQIKVVQKSAFISRFRTRELEDGKLIFGTMHEKFGVFYDPGMKIPFTSFSGSSNISFGSDQKFAENRFVFKNDPVVARQFAEEFARLWNEYGTDFLGNAESEIFIPADPIAGTVKCVFNGEPINEEEFFKIDETIGNMIRKVSYTNGTIDIFMFSFTHWQLAQQLLEYAQRYPTVKIRMLMDQTQLISDDAHRGILGPYLEEKAIELGITNLQIKYKWRSNIYGWEEQLSNKKEEEKTEKIADDGGKVDLSVDGVPGIESESSDSEDETQNGGSKHEKFNKAAQIHWRSLILHHKVIVVDKKAMIAGSYNWSSSAERRNLENVMVFNGKYPGHQNAIDRMMAEFDYLWNSDYKPAPKKSATEGPQVVSGPEGRKLVTQILQTLNKPNMQAVVQFVEFNKNCTIHQIVKGTNIKADVVRPVLEELVQAGILYSNRSKYGLAD